MRGAVVWGTIVCLCAIGPTRIHAAEAKDEPKLWAGITASTPVVHGRAPRLQIYFSLVNDGQRTVDPKIGSSKLVINGKVPKDWDFVINNGPRSSEADALPPGRFLLFGYALERYFGKPGVYRVYWKGEAFKSPVIVIRVMPDD
jgi:hypothetical protein